MSARGSVCTIAVSVMTLALWTPPPADAGLIREGASIALVVNVDSYLSIEREVPGRNNTGAVQDLARRLQDSGYQLRLFSGSATDRLRTITELSRLGETSTRDDALIVLLAGTLARSRLNQKLYWLTHDSRLDLLDGSSIRLAHLIEYIAEIPASRKLVLIDAVFGGDLETYESFGERGIRAAFDLRGAPPSAAQLDEELRISGDDLDVLVYVAPHRRQRWEDPDLEEQPQERTLSFLATQALAGTAADVDGDGSLSVSELVGFVRDSAPESNRLFFQSSFGPWAFASVGEGYEEDRAAEYEAILLDWRRSGWISTRTFIMARKALEAWRESERSGIEIEPSHRRVLDEFRAVLDARGTVEEGDLASTFDILVAGSK